MDLLDYTDYDNVRSLLGVNAKEVADATIGLEVYSNGLLLDLQDIAAAIPARYLAVDETQEADRTAEEARFYMTARTFAAYSVAKLLTTSLPMFAPKEISDSKTLLGRFAANPYADTILKVEEGFALNRQRLIAAFNTLITPPDAPPRTWLAISSPSSDPVTGT
jgi:hypothetical protein